MSEDKMLDMWKDISQNYGKAKDLEEKQRIILSNFLKGKKGKILELGCGNGRILDKIYKINLNLELNGLDYSNDMIREAKKNYGNINFLEGNILNAENIFKNNKFDIVFSVNTLHNLPNKDLIFTTFEKMNLLTRKGGYIIFDIRNYFNPFIAYGYFKNRKKGLDFWTLNIFTVIKFFKKYNIEVIYKKGTYYKNIKESLFINKNIFLRFLYNLYLKITSFTIFSQYIFIILKKK